MPGEARDGRKRRDSWHSRTGSPARRTLHEDRDDPWVAASIYSWREDLRRHCAVIVRAAVEGLLGEFDHEISFRDDWEFAIAYGLNGVGKTKFLELINAATVPDYAKLGFTRFTKLILDSDSGSSLEIERTEVDEERGKVANLKFRVVRPKAKFPAWTHQIVLTPDDEFVRWLTRYTSWVPTDDPFL